MHVNHPLGRPHPIILGRRWHLPVFIAWTWILCRGDKELRRNHEKPEWIERAIQEGVAALHKDRPLDAGLYLPDFQGDDFDRAVKSAMAGGAKGVALFGGLKTVKTPE